MKRRESKPMWVVPMICEEVTTVVDHDREGKYAENCSTWGKQNYEDGKEVSQVWL